MKNGFITLSLTGYIALGCAAVVAVVSGYAYIQTKRLEACKSEFQVFKSEVERVAKEQDLNNKVKKQKADDELKKLKSVNADLSKRLRDNASTSFVQPSTDTGKPERACFDQSAIDSAIKRFAERASGIAEEGQSAIDSLNNAKRWAVQ